MFKDLQQHNQEYHQVSKELNIVSDQLTSLKQNIQGVDTTIHSQDINLKTLYHQISHKKTDLLLSQAQNNPLDELATECEGLYEKWLKLRLEFGYLNEQIIEGMIKIATQKYNYCKDIQKEYDSSNHQNENNSLNSPSSSTKLSPILTGNKSLLKSTSNSSFNDVAQILHSIGIDTTLMISQLDKISFSFDIPDNFPLSNPKHPTQLPNYVVMPFNEDFLTQRRQINELPVKPAFDQFNHLSLLNIRHLYDTLYGSIWPLVYHQFHSNTRIGCDTESIGYDDTESKDPNKEQHRMLFTSLVPFNDVQPTYSTLPMDANNSQQKKMQMQFVQQQHQQSQQQSLSDRLIYYKQRVNELQRQIIDQYNNNPINRQRVLQNECDNVDARMVIVKRKIMATQRSLIIKRGRIDELLTQIRFEEGLKLQQKPQTQSKPARKKKSFEIEAPASVAKSTALHSAAPPSILSFTDNQSYHNSLYQRNSRVQKPSEPAQTNESDDDNWL